MLHAYEATGDRYYLDVARKAADAVVFGQHPLAVTLSANGRPFERSFLLRGAADLQPLRYEGQYKRPGYHYPKSTIWNGFSYVANATNKENVEVTRVPLSSLGTSN